MKSLKITALSLVLVLLYISNILFKGIQTLEQAIYHTGINFNIAITNL